MMGWWLVLAHSGGTEWGAVKMNRVWRVVRLMGLIGFDGIDRHIERVNRVWGVRRLMFSGGIEPGLEGVGMVSKVSKKALLSRPGGEVGSVAL